MVGSTTMATELSSPALSWLAHLPSMVLAANAVLGSGSEREPVAIWRRSSRLAAAAAILAGGWAAVATGRGGWVGAPAVVAALIAGLGWVITRFAATYLRGEPRQAHFARWLSVTLASATLVCATDQLLVLTLAWLATSVAIGKLLTFYANRPQAVLAAHQKFLVSRLADVLMLAATVVFIVAAGTQHLPTLLALGAAGEIPNGVRAGVLLMALAAVLKCALLPCHGWLMKVMEAPTPVSALLHAGVVNLGGLVLIRIGPLVALTPTAQLLLVAAGSATAVAAGLTTTTRISVKVALAWSTCAQMGFMVVQCGLGLFDLALLHLIGHSLYKAHAFLGAGGTVQATTVRTLFPPRSQPAVARFLASAAVGVLLALTAAWSIGLPFADRPELCTMLVVLGLSTAPLLERANHWGAGGLTAGGTIVAYLLLHDGLARWFGAAPPPAPLALAAAACAAFVALCLLQALLRSPDQPRWLQQLRQLCFHGLHLDEWLTRVTWRVWPPRTVPPHRLDLRLIRP